MKNKGITLLALIVTVIIMIILASVSIRLIISGGIINKTREASVEYERQADYEEFLLAVTGAKEYFEGAVNVENLKSTLGEGWTVEEKDGMIKCTSVNGNEFEIEKINGIRREVLVEVEDKYGNKYTYYRLDKVTDEEREKCREQGIPMIVGDGNFDDKIDDLDVEIVGRMASGSQNADKYQKVILDFNLNGVVDSLDLPIEVKLSNKTISLRILAIHKETGIDEKKIIQDDKTGKLYFIEEQVTVEEGKELEKYGVKRTILGDVDLDGKLTQNDVNLISKFYGGEKTPTKIEKMLADMNQNNDIDPSDVSMINGKVNN